MTKLRNSRNAMTKPKGFELNAMTKPKEKALLWAECNDKTEEFLGMQ